MAGIVVIGAGQAGATVIEKLRAHGYDGPLSLIGDEPHPPYQRPPLSKAYLLGEMAKERLFLRPLSYYEDHDVKMHLGVRAIGINRQAHEVHLADGVSVPYTRLVLVTGSCPRRLPRAVGGNLEGVYTVRDLTDVDKMAHQFQPDARVLVIGGGYIGLEAAAVAVTRGLKVTLIEVAERILNRVSCHDTAAYFRNLHQSHGVDLREGVGLERLSGDVGRVTAAHLTDSTQLDIDFAIAGVGVQPETWLAESAGLDIGNGIIVDAQGRTSDPDIFAAGDCTDFPYGDGRIRLESVPNAIDQAGVVAQVLTGQDAEYTAKPWFWSDQYDCKLQIAGLNTGFNDVAIRPGQRAGGLSVWYFKGDRLLAVDAMNDPKAYMQAKRWIEAGLSPKPADVADVTIDLRGMVAE